MTKTVVFQISRKTSIDSISVEVTQVINTEYTLHAGLAYMVINQEQALILQRMLSEALKYCGV